MRFYKSKKKPEYQPNDDNQICVLISASVGKEMRAQLQDLNFNWRVPVSRLIYIALEKELESETPFTYVVEIPEKVNEALYISECRKLIDFLERAPKGLDLELIVLMRRDIGILDKDKILAAMRVLLDAELVEEFKPAPNRTPRPKGYTKFRVVNAKYRPDRFRSIDGESTKGKHTIRDEDLTDEPQD